MTATTLTPPQRSRFLTVVCVLGFLGCFLKMFAPFSSEIQAVRTWYPSYISLSTILLMGLLFGLMQMRRWALWGSLAFIVIDQGVQFSLGRWAVAPALYFLLLLLAAIPSYKKMV